MRLISLGQRERGDTIIEVLFAITVFAMVAVGSLSIMNQGTATAQRALEITLVRQQIDAQAEAIRYVHKAYIASYQKDTPPPAGSTQEQWVIMTNKATGKGVDSASEFGQTDVGQCPGSVPGEKPFILNARTAKVASPPVMSPPADGSLPPFAQVLYNNDSSINQAYGLWVEAVPSTTVGSTGFVDFHIRACWSGPGSTAPMTLGTIVRLYEPR